MNADSLKVPLNENFIVDIRRKKSNGGVIAAFCCLVLLSSTALAFSVYAVVRLNDLENEYQTVIKNLLDDDLYKDMAEFQNEEENMDGQDDMSDYEDDYPSNDINNNEITRVPDNGLLLYGGDFTKDDLERKKRSVIGATPDGIPIYAESYADMQRKNNTLRKLTNPNLHVVPVSARPSAYGSTWSGSSYEVTSAPEVYSRASRVMHKEDKSKAFKQIVRKSMLRAADASAEEYSSEAPNIIRDSYGRKRFRNRPSRLESFEDTRPGHKMGRIKPLPSIRVDGDTSKYVLGQHQNFNGNGHMRHPSKTYVDWKAKNWVDAGGMYQHFDLNEEGELTIKESGLYFIYAQIYYLDEHDTNGFRVYKNGGNTLLQCTTSTHTQESTLKGNTCYTAGADYLNENDIIYVSDLAEGRYSLFEPGKSFFGVIKLGDMKVK